MGIENFRVVRPGGGVRYDLPGLGTALVFIATQEDTDSAYSVYESIHAPGSGPPLHVHRHHNETGYVLEGHFLVECGDAPLARVEPGSFLHFPAGQPHTFKCVGDRPGKILFWMAPGGFERFFQDVMVEAGGAEPDMALLIEVGSRHDFEIAGPPIADEG